MGLIGAAAAVIIAAVVVVIVCAIGQRAAEQGTKAEAKQPRRDAVERAATRAIEIIIFTVAPTAAIIAPAIAVAWVAVAIAGDHTVTLGIVWAIAAVPLRIAWCGPRVGGR